MKSQASGGETFQQNDGEISQPFADDKGVRVKHHHFAREFKILESPERSIERQNFLDDVTGFALSLRQLCLADHHRFAFNEDPTDVGKKQKGRRDQHG